MRIGRRGLAREAPGDARPVEVLHERVDIGADVGPEIDVIGMLVHIERQDRRAAGQAVCVVGTPDIRQGSVARRTRQQHPARTTTQRLAHGDELGAPLGERTEVARDRVGQGALGLSAAAFAGAGQAVEVDLVQQHRVGGDQFLALQPVQAKAGQLGRIARGQVGVDGVQPSHRAAVVVDVMAADQIAGQALQSDWFEGDGSRVILHYLLVIHLFHGNLSLFCEIATNK